MTELLDEARRERVRSGWWRTAVIYQVYIRSFADADGDGVGDLPGLRSRLGYLADLGVDALWVTPFYPSPMADFGYDVADYRDVDPTFGTLADAEALIADAHALGLKVIFDIVPNHTSDRHPWFQEALAAGPGSPGARAVHLPGRPGAERRAAPQRLGVGVRRPGLDPGPRRAVVPAPVRPRPARPQLGEPGGARRVRVDPAVLARPRRGRLPHRRRPRHGEGPRPARRGPRRPDPHARHRRAAVLRPGRRARDPPLVAAAARLLPRGADRRGRGVGAHPRAARQLRAARRAAPGVQLPLPDRRLGRRRSCAR